MKLYIFFLFLLLSIIVNADSSNHKRQAQDVSSIMVRNTILESSKSDLFEIIQKRQEENDDSQNDQDETSNDTTLTSEDGDSSSTPPPDQSEKSHHRTELSTTAASTPVPATSIGTAVTQSSDTQISHSDGPVNVENVLDTLPECYKTCATTVATSYKIGCSKLTQLGCICPQPRFFNLTIKCITFSGTKNCVNLAQNEKAMQESQSTFIKLCQSAGAGNMDETPSVHSSLPSSNAQRLIIYTTSFVLIPLFICAIVLL